MSNNLESLLSFANERLSNLYPTKHKPILATDLENVYRRNGLLSIDADAKTSKGVAQGYLTGILYLSPSNYFTKANLCPFASESCKSACLFSAGRGKFYSVTRARVVKTLAYLNDTPRFMATLIQSIVKLQRKAKRLNLKPAVRLNGTSDIDWSTINLKDDTEHADIFEYFRDVQFYDYTKDPTKAVRNPHKNYHLTFSDSGANGRMVKLQPATVNIATVFLGSLPTRWNGRKVINGDMHDLRFLDEKNVVVGLTAKGQAKSLRSDTFVKIPCRECGWQRGCDTCMKWRIA